MPFHDDFFDHNDDFTRRGAAGLGILAAIVGVFAVLLNVAFWLAVIFGTLWGLDHFGVLDKF
jgi:hypothetical protein